MRLWFLPATAKGFAAPDVNLPGGVTSMLGGDLGRANGFTRINRGAINGHPGLNWRFYRQPGWRKSHRSVSTEFSGF